MKQNKIFGGILILVSAITGVNILSLPIMSANIGFIPGVLLLVFIWALTTITGLLALEVTLNFQEYVNGFSSMAESTLGKTGKIIAWLCLLLPLYAFIASGITSVASLPSHIKVFNIQFPSWFNAVLLVLLTGGVIISGNNIVDLCNRGLLVVKCGCLFLIAIFLMPHSNLNIMFFKQYINFSNHLYFFSTITMLLGSFGYHFLIPGLCNYIGRKPKELKRVIIISQTVGLIIMMLVLALATNTNSVIWPNISLGDNNKWFVFGINGFFNIALLTSFFIFSWGLFDFLADGFKRKNSRSGRFQTVLLVFVPPIICGLFYPPGFIWVLEYATIFTVVLVVILPALMVYSLRRKNKISPYQVVGGKALLVAIVIVGVFLLILPALS